MDPNTCNTKRNFVKNELGRCVSAMLPEVVRLEYRAPAADRELVVIHAASGGAAAADVTGMDLPETARAVFEALGLLAPAC